MERGTLEDERMYWLSQAYEAYASGDMARLSRCIEIIRKTITDDEPKKELQEKFDSLKQELDEIEKEKKKEAAKMDEYDKVRYLDALRMELDAAALDGSLDILTEILTRHNLVPKRTATE